MSKNQDHIEKIEAFLEGRLDPAGHTEFEKSLQSNEALRKEYENYQLALKAISNRGLKDRLNEIHHEVIPQKRKTRQWLIPLGIAASVTILSIFFFLPDEQSMDQLYDQYYVPLAIPNLRDSPANDTQYPHYSAGEYQKAFDRLNRKIEPSSMDILVLGNTLIELKKYQEAIEIFSRLKNDPNTQIRHHALWYSAIVNIKVGDQKAAIQDLDELSSNSIYQREARELIDRIGDSD